MTKPSVRLLNTTISKTLLFCGLWLCIMLVCIETAVLVAGAITPNLFDKLYGTSAQVLSAIEKLDAKSYARFSMEARKLPAIWDGRDGIGTTKSCLGKVVRATYDSTGARTYPGYTTRSATVLLIGDSYTHGDEVADAHTISAHLFRRTSIVSANLGVGGYSPLQAVLKLQSVAKSFPAASVAILGIMHENIRRNVNSYMAIFTGPQGVLALRPHVRDGKIVMVPPQAFDGLKAFRPLARQALHDDFWATPSASFPYTLSLFSLFGTNHFRIRNKSRVMKLLGRQYAPDYADTELAGALSLVVKRFGQVAAKASLKPIVIFIPQNRHDLTSPAVWIREHRKMYGTDVDLRMLDRESVDWARYNQKPDGSCHPSSYGYDAISRTYATALAQAVGGLSPKRADASQ